MYESIYEKFEEIMTWLEQQDQDFLRGAFYYAKNAHNGQLRKSWEEYFVHPVSVATELWYKFHDIKLTAAALLHDTVEDNPNIQISEIYDKFWKEIGFLVDAVTKNKDSFYLMNINFERKIDKLLFWWFQNIKCFLLKIADRNDNLKTIGNLKDNKQIRMAFETQAIFSPLEELLKYETIISYQQATDNFIKYLDRHRISKPFDLKNHLIATSFHDLGKDWFEAIYTNTHNVTWKINTKEMFQDFFKIPGIDDKIELVYIETTQDDTCSICFKFKKGGVIWEKLKFWIWEVYSYNN